MRKTIDRTNISYYLAMDSRVNIKGESKIYLRFFENGKKKDFFTGVNWPKKYFNQRQQRLNKRYETDLEVEPMNLILSQNLTIIHRVQMEAFLNNRELKVDDLLDSLKNVSSQTDYVRFATLEINRLYNNDVIANETWRRHRSSLNRATDFFGPVIFLESITPEKLVDFDAFWRKKGKANNTIAGYHKDFKKYLNIAVEKNYIKANPYNKFKFGYVDGDREALTQKEVKRLMKMYKKDKVKGTEKEILRRFLFSCLTGIRISDTHRVTTDMIVDNKLKFKPKKGLRYGKIVRIPLPSSALKLIKGRDGLLFDSFSDQHINACLKLIAARAKITKNLTYHCARDTFGTIFIELGGDIKSLCDIMGHSNTKTTEIYLKMSDQRKSDLMNNFDTMFVKKDKLI